MKTKYLLAFISLFAITTVARANNPSTHVLVLPAYVVTAPRTLPIEQSVNTSLEAFRQQNLNRLQTILASSQVFANSLRPLQLATATPASVKESPGKVKS